MSNKADTVSVADNYFLQREEPARSCLLALRHMILGFDPGIQEAWKYGMPFYYYKGKMFCYLWTRKKEGAPYLGLAEGRRIDHPLLLAEKRSRMKIMLFDPAKNIPFDTVNSLLKQASAFYK